MSIEIDHARIRREVKLNRKVVRARRCGVALRQLDKFSSLVSKHLTDEEREANMAKRKAKSGWEKKAEALKKASGLALYRHHTNALALAMQRAESPPKRNRKPRKSRKKVTKKSSSGLAIYEGVIVSEGPSRKPKRKRKSGTSPKKRVKARLRRDDLLKRKKTVRKPHKPGCKCIVCVNKRKKRGAAKRKASSKKRKSSSPKKRAVTAKKRKKPCPPKKRAVSFCAAKKKKVGAKKKRKTTAKKASPKKRKPAAKKRKAPKPRRVNPKRGALVPKHRGRATCSHCGGPHSKSEHWSHLGGPRGGASYEKARPIQKSHAARLALLIADVRAKHSRLGRGKKR